MKHLTDPDPKLLDEVLRLAKIRRKDWKPLQCELILSGEPIAAFLKTRIGTFYDKEILKYVTGIEATRNIVIDGTTVPVDASSGRYVAQAGTLMVNNAGQTGINEVQTLSVPSDATGGTFQLVLPPFGPAAGGSGLTAPLPFNTAGRTAQNVQDALAALPDIGQGNVAVTLAAGTPPAADVYTITFQGALGGAVIPQLQTANSSLVGGTAALATAITTPGRAAIATQKAAPAAASGVVAGTILGILTHTVEFFYPPEPNVTDEPAAVYFHQCVFDSTKLINVSGNLAATQAALPTCLFQ